jgi:transketolase
VRREFVESLVELATRDERVMLLTGDLGFTVLEPFAELFPDRFINAGVAEQNMIGVATGLAEAGYRPYVYSIATFASMRGYEFIRNGPVQHKLPVRIVGVGGGVEYGHNGLSHYALEDVALMRTQPDLTVVAPAEPDQVRAAMTAVAEVSGPAYLRLSKESVPVPGLDGRFRFGRAELIGDGEDVVIVALGAVAADAVAVAERLATWDIAATVAVVSTVSPAPTRDLIKALRRVPLAVTVEAHYVNGGLGSLVAEVIAENQVRCRLIRAGITTMPAGITGSRAYLHARLGIGEEQLVELITEAQGVRPDRLTIS